MVGKHIVYLPCLPLFSKVGCLLTGLSYMELSSVVPSNGSVYSFAYVALGEPLAVLGAAKGARGLAKSGLVTPRLHAPA